MKDLSLAHFAVSFLKTTEKNDNKISVNFNFSSNLF